MGGLYPPGVAYVYAPDRTGERPLEHLKGFTGVLQVDGYAGFKGLLTGRPPDRIKLAFCWAHCRRGFYYYCVMDCWPRVVARSSAGSKGSAAGGASGRPRGAAARSRSRPGCAAPGAREELRGR